MESQSPGGSRSRCGSRPRSSRTTSCYFPSTRSPTAYSLPLSVSAHRCARTGAQLRPGTCARGGPDTSRLPAGHHQAGRTDILDRNRTDPRPFSRQVASAYRRDVRRQRGHLRNPPDGGSSSYGRVRVATTRVPMIWMSATARLASSASSAAQSMPTEAHRNHGPIALDDSSRTQPVSNTLDHRIEFGDAAASAAQQFSRPPQHAQRVTAEPDVAVGQQHRLPSAGAGQRLEHVAAQRRRAAAPRQFDGRGGLVDAQRRNATLDEVCHQTAWAATQVDGRPFAQPHHRAIELARRHGGRPASCAPEACGLHRRRGGSNIAHRRVRGRRSSRTSSDPRRSWPARIGCRARTRAEPRRCLRRCPHPPVRRPDVTFIPCVAKRRKRYSAGVRPRHRHRRADSRPCRRRSRRAPTTRRPAPGRAPRRLPAAPCAHSTSISAVTCGVSMPICRTGRPPRAAAASACALASRSAKSTPRCATTVKSARTLGSRRCAGRLQIACQRHHPRLDRRRATASSVSSNAAAAMSAAARRRRSPPAASSPGRAPAPWPPPARDGNHEITRQKSTAAMKLPRTDPLTFDLPPVRGPYATSRSTTASPLAPHAPTVPAGSRIGGPSRPARAERRGGPPASARCRARAGRSGCAAASTPPRCPAGHAMASAAP